MSNLGRKTHFLGAKFRNLRKRNKLTLQDVSTRCIQINAEIAPSVSYLSMIETGKRTPSEDVLELLASVFQKSTHWFLDESTDIQESNATARPGGQTRIPLEPGFLFSKDLLEAAIPELLSQTGTTGRQFAHLLIRSYQEAHQNDFPDLERSAEEIGERRFPLKIDDLYRLYKRHGLKIHWFDRESLPARNHGRQFKTMIRSFFDSPNNVYINEGLQKDSARLKYELASNLGHKVLHDGDGLKSVHATGGQLGGTPETGTRSAGGLNSRDVLFAWRDFECGFFAEALLCPKQAFRRFLMREQYRMSAREKLDLTPAVYMRRMTAASPYRYWHYFDAYPPGYLRSVYRGNGIPLPWGNMAMVTDPCPRWAVFYMLRKKQAGAPSSQISVLQEGEHSSLYCCHSLRTADSAGNPHVLSVGIDLTPALESQGFYTAGIVQSIAAACQKGGGQGPVPKPAQQAIRDTGRVLSIAWVSDALDSPASIICPRSTACPRPVRCENLPEAAPVAEINNVRQQIILDQTINQPIEMNIAKINIDRPPK
jgi:transcriptional regulator with XRE-family HTH domain